MPGQIKIEIANESDIPQVQVVARESWRSTYADLIPAEIQDQALDAWYSYESLAAAVHDRRAVFIVARSGSRVVGFAQFVINALLSELTRIYVLPDQQRRGIGQALLGFGLTAMKDGGASELAVSVERDNAKGCAFYSKHGFMHAGEVSASIFGHSVPLRRMKRQVATTACC
jgi:ribosomal protein S18 acetylase RimI-like enzyme